MSLDVFFLLGLTRREESSSVDDAESIQTVVENLKNEHTDSITNECNVSQKSHTDTTSE
jgi:hypothetical protein